MAVSPDSPARQVAQEWLKTAEHDFAVVQALNKDPDDAYLSAICFHAQQCVEKILKAVLILRGSDVPRTHDLETLTDLLTQAGVPTVGIARVQ